MCVRDDEQDIVDIVNHIRNTGKKMANTDGRTCDPGCILKHVLEVPNTRKFISEIHYL